MIFYSIQQQQSKLCNKIKSRHQKKLDNLVVNKRLDNRIHPTPNNLITNLSKKELSRNRGFTARVEPWFTDMT